MVAAAAAEVEEADVLGEDDGLLELEMEFILAESTVRRANRKLLEIGKKEIE